MKLFHDKSVWQGAGIGILVGSFCGGVLFDLVDKESYSLIYDLTYRDRIDIVMLSEYYSSVAGFWKEEVSRRYGDAVMILGHGGEDEKGRWIIWDAAANQRRRIEDVVKEVRKRYPYRRIVVVTCNPGHQYLNARYVAYAIEDVWKIPDHVMFTRFGLVLEPQNIGDIFKFVENP